MVKTGGGNRVPVELLFDMGPEVLNGFRSIGKASPEVGFLLKPFECRFRGVFGVLPEVEAVLVHAQFLHTFHHSTLQDFHMLLCIHPVLYLCKY
jgi:hypothetical protein